MPFSYGGNISDNITTVERLAVAANSYSTNFNQNIILLWAHIAYVSSAVPGNRQFELGILTSSDLGIFDTNAGAVQAAGQTRHYSVFQGIYRELAFTDDELQMPIPIDAYILLGQKLNFKDNNNVDAAGDSMIISYCYKSV